MKLFQVNEDDLAELERTLPAFIQRHDACMDRADRAAVRRMQAILLNIRWDYGPHTDVEQVPFEEGPLQ